MRQHKHMAQTTDHALIHKTWFCHDPASWPEKNQPQEGRIMTKPCYSLKKQSWYLLANS